MRRAAAVLTFTVMFIWAGRARPGRNSTSAFDRTPNRPWIGPDYWANPLQDWRIAGGALECIRPGPARSLMLLTRELSDRPAPFSSSIALAPSHAPADQASSAWVGFRLAARGRFGDYRDDAVYGKGMRQACGPTGHCSSEIRRMQASARRQQSATCRSVWPNQEAAGSLRHQHVPGTQGRERAQTLLDVADPRALRGAIGIVCNDAPCRIASWQASGPKLDTHGERAFGPILFTQYTLSGRVLKLTAQLAPVGPADGDFATLSVLTRGTAAAGKSGAR